MSADVYVQPPLPGMPVVVDLDGTGMELVRSYLTAKKAIEKWSEFRDEARQQLTKMISGGEDAEPGKYVASYNGQGVLKLTIFTEQRFDSATFKTDHPDLYEAYRKEVRKQLLTRAGALPEADDDA